MKKIFSLFSIALFMSACAMQNKGGTVSSQVIRDCTGTYLRINQKDFHVCNVSALSKVKDGEVVEAKFKKVKECEQTGMVCMMYHENEGWIRILKIKD